jgi:hypothetical protein
MNSHHIPHDPGAPPHRPQLGVGSLAPPVFPESAATAKTLSAFLVFFDRHSGHATAGASVIDRCNCSKVAPQDSQAYS